MRGLGHLLLHGGGGGGRSLQVIRKLLLLLLGLVTAGCAARGVVRGMMVPRTRVRRDAHAAARAGRQPGTGGRASGGTLRRENAAAAVVRLRQGLGGVLARGASLLSLTLRRRDRRRRRSLKDDVMYVSSRDVMRVRGEGEARERGGVIARGGGL